MASETNDRRRTRRRQALVFGCGLIAAVGTAPAVAQTPCADLAALALAGRGTVTAAETIAGSFTPPGATAPLTGLPSLCRIAATLAPSPDSSIRIEVWLPEGAAWNGRYLGTGNGGYAGAIRYADIAVGVRLGFATANTDLGTLPANVLDGRALVGRPQRWIDFGGRATHLMTRAAKQLVDAFYGQAPAYSYFSGCSTGGQQAYQEAQRYPKDYDGILAGAPANNRTHLHASIGAFYGAVRDSADSFITRPTAEVITRAAVAACKGRDIGGLPTDAFLSDPRQCRWDPARIACTPGADPAQCLTPGQVQAARNAYDGARAATGGPRVYTGLPRGSESGHTFDWAFIAGLLNPAAPSANPPFDGVVQWAFGADFKTEDFDFSPRSVRQLDAVLARSLNANDPDLSGFRARGGKLLSYHGWQDSLVNPQDNINYYLRAVQVEAGADPASIRGGVDAVPRAALNRTAEFYRLFLAPGVGHCGGGLGPNVFLPSTLNLLAGDPDRNALLALQRWVEDGVAPERIIATRFTATGTVEATRPLCAFPEYAEYRGGDPTDAASFVCVRGPVGPNQNVPAENLR